MTLQKWIGLRSAALLVILGGCSTTSTTQLEPCTAGEKVACELGGCTGTKTCNPDGRGYQECVCDATGGAGGMPSAGAGGVVVTGGVTNGGGGTAGQAGASGTVVTTIDSVGDPVGAVTIVVHDADGHVVTTTATGTDGKVSVDIPDGGAVTVVDQGLMTFLDISGARSIVATVGPEPMTQKPTFGAGTALSLNLSAAMTLAYYDVVVPPCIELFSQQTTAQATYDLSGCPQGPIDIYAIGNDASGFPMLFGSTFNLSPIAGSTTTQSLVVGTTTFNNLSGTIGPLPTGTTSVDETLKLRRGDRYAGSFSDYQVPKTSSTTWSMRFPAVAVDGFRLQQGVSWPLHSASRDVRAPSLAANLGTWAPLALAPVDVSPVTFPQASRPNATWTLGTGAAGDAIVVFLMWSPSSGDASSWALVVPSSATSATAPELPASLSGYAIGAGATVNYYQVIHEEMPSVSGYLQFLAAPVKPDSLGYFPYHSTANCEVIRSSGSLD